MAGYMRRMIAAGVGRRGHALEHEPTRAEFESQVYDLTYAHQSGGRMALSVLALNPEHADVLGRLRMESQRAGSSAEGVLLERVAWGFDYDRVTAVLSYESEAEREHRRQAYRARVAS